MMKTRKQGTVSKLAGKARAGLRKAAAVARVKPSRRTVKQPVTRPIHDHD